MSCSSCSFSGGQNSSNLFKKMSRGCFSKGMSRGFGSTFVIVVIVLIVIALFGYWWFKKNGSSILVGNLSSTWSPTQLSSAKSEILTSVKNKIVSLIKNQLNRNLNGDEMSRVNSLLTTRAVGKIDCLVNKASQSYTYLVFRSEALLASTGFPSAKFQQVQAQCGVTNPQIEVLAANIVSAFMDGRST